MHSIGHRVFLKGSFVKQVQSKAKKPLIFIS